MKLKLMPKFILSLTILGVLLSISVSIFSYQNSKTYLEDMYAQRAVSGSKSIAHMLALEDVKTVIGPGGDQTEQYREMAALFDQLKKDGEITFLSLVTLDADSVTFYIDSCVPEMGDDPANQLPYGSDFLYTEVASDEKDLEKYITIWNLYDENRGLDAPLVTDNAYGYNYSAVWPILDEDGQAIAEVQYILDMQQVRDHLNSFLYSMMGISLVVILAAIALYILFVNFVVTKPIAKLARFTDQITKTQDFAGKSISIKTGDEIEALGDSFNFMLREIEDYIENLSKVTSEKERIGAELDIATHIQASMLPCIFPAFPERSEFDIFASMVPAKEVGGDFYDFFMVDDTHLAVVMADVSGKGVPAALFMVIGKTLIKDHTQPGRSLGQVFTDVNRLLCEANSEGLFITAFEGVLDITTGEFTYVNAGHEPPYICRRDDEFRLHKIRPGFVLAGLDTVRYRAGTTTLAPGDKVFLYTDGVTEATDSHNVLYGMDRMAAALNRVKDRAPSGILPAVKQDIDAFVGEAPQFDDITMLCLEYKGLPGRELTLDATLENIPVVTEFVDRELAAAGCSLKAQTQIDIAIDELFSNIARYAYDTTGQATVGIRIENGAAAITFTDSGKPYNPLEKGDPDTTLSAEDRSVGGLGIFMVKKSMDDMTYRYENNQNILRIVKKI